MIGGGQALDEGPFLRTEGLHVEVDLERARGGHSVGIEAAGHYHRPLLTPSSWPTGWELLELNPAHVTEQRRAMGHRRVKTDAIDLEAMTELVLAGRGSPSCHAQKSLASCPRGQLTALVEC